MVVFALGLVACGLSVVGTDPLPITQDTDAGPSASGSNGTSSSSSSSSSSTSSSAPVDAAPDVVVTPTAITCTAIKADPTVNRCLDFDGPSGGNEGFNGLYTGNTGGTKSASKAIETSPITGAGQAFGLTFAGDNAVGKHDYFAKLLIDGFPSNTIHRVTIDVDITIDTFDIQAMNLAGFHFSGNSPCVDTWSGLGVNELKQLVHFSDEAKQVVGTFTLGVPFHAHFEAEPGVPGNRDDVVSIDGGKPDGIKKKIDSACNVGETIVGSYFTSTEANASFHVRFDQMVVRTN